MEVPSCENHVSMASWTPERKNRIKDRTPHIFIYFLYKIGDLSSFWRCGIWHGYLIIKKGSSSMDNGFGMIWVWKWRRWHRNGLKKKTCVTSRGKPNNVTYVAWYPFKVIFDDFGDGFWQGTQATPIGFMWYHPTKHHCNRCQAWIFLSPKRLLNRMRLPLKYIEVSWLVEE